MQLVVADSAKMMYYFVRHRVVSPAPAADNKQSFAKSPFPQNSHCGHQPVQILPGLWRSHKEDVRTVRPPTSFAEKQIVDAIGNDADFFRRHKKEGVQIVGSVLGGCDYSVSGGEQPMHNSSRVKSVPGRH